MGAAKDSSAQMRGWGKGQLGSVRKGGACCDDGRLPLFVLLPVFVGSYRKAAKASQGTTPHLNCEH